MDNARRAPYEGQPRQAALSPTAWSVRRWLLPCAVVAAVLLVDQLTKWQVRMWLGPGHPTGEWHLVGTWLGLDYVENTGAAFGTLTGKSNWLTIGALVVVAVAGVLYARLRQPGRLVQIGLGLLVGGAIGNVIDRVALGYVVDFLAVGPWPRFNVADSAVTVGVIVLLWKLGGPEPSRR